MVSYANPFSSSLRRWEAERGLAGCARLGGFTPGRHPLPFVLRLGRGFLCYSRAGDGSALLYMLPAQCAQGTGHSGSGGGGGQVVDESAQCTHHLASWNGYVESGLVCVRETLKPTPTHSLPSPVSSPQPSRSPSTTPSSPSRSSALSFLSHLQPFRTRHSFRVHYTPSAL